MRLVTYDVEGIWHAGIVIENKVVDATSAARAADFNDGADVSNISNRVILQANPDKQSRLEKAAYELASSSTDEVLLLERLHLGPPIPNPDKIICVGFNYKSHAEEADFEPPKIPILFAKFRNALIGPTDSIILTELSEEIDFEGELAVVIGKQCKHVSVEDALDYVSGYMLLNDVSARDLQFRTGQYMSGKALDTFAPCGPALVIGEINNPQNLDITTRVNGLVMQQSNTGNMIFSVADLISYTSQLMTLEPGDIISTGTPEGTGFKRTPPVFLRHGDMVEVKVEKIGMIKNPVVSPV